MRKLAVGLVLGALATTSAIADDTNISGTVWEGEWSGTMINPTRMEVAEHLGVALSGTIVITWRGSDYDYAAKGNIVHLDGGKKKIDLQLSRGDRRAHFELEGADPGLAVGSTLEGTGRSGMHVGPLKLTRVK